MHTSNADDDEPPGEPESKELSSVSERDFAEVDCEAPISTSRKVYARSLASIYQQAHQEEQKAGDERRAKVYRLLAEVTKMHFKPDDGAEPYGPNVVWDGKRSIIPSDLRGAPSEAFAAIAPSIKNAGLRALLADLAWLNDRKQAPMAQLAIGSFCDAVQAVADGNAELFFEDAKATCRNGAQMLRRACQIANMTGWKDPEASVLNDVIRTLSEAAYKENDVRGFLHMGELDADYRITAAAVMAQRGEELAKAPELHPDTARELWELAARSHRQNNQEAESNRCLVSAAECYVRMAEASGLKGMAASSWLMDAIKALRGLPGTKARRQELEAKLRAAQATIADEMGTYSTTTDITELVDHARKTVRGLTLAEALRQFACLERSPPPEKLREDAVRQAEEHPLQMLIPQSIHDDEGKVVAKSPGGIGAAEEEEDALRRMIIRSEAFRRQLAAAGMIEPARRLIMAEHPLDTYELLVIVHNSPFVPPDYADVYALGFARFFAGDVVSALHILVPQLENSLRHVLRQIGVDASSIQNDMTQENRTLATMLAKDREALEKVFGPAIIYDIENLFDFRGGPALRHQLAHGLLSAGECRGHDAVYACWFVFRLCCIPLFRHWQQIADAYAER